MPTKTEISRLRWRCRRGMRELDTLLLAYVNNRYSHAELAEQQAELDAKYKLLCAKWVKEVTSEEELAEVKALYAAKDFDSLLEKLNEYKVSKAVVVIVAALLLLLL